jgi:hypothetical protein
VFCVTGGVEKHIATALASIAMLDEKAAARILKPDLTAGFEFFVALRAA